MKSVYVETSILSYLTARPTRDLLAAGRQQMTHEWWNTRRSRFDVYVSPLVEQEARRGDPDAAGRRVEALGDVPTLEIVEEAYGLAAAFIAEGALPRTAEDDATHIALAAVHGMDYLDVELPTYRQCGDQADRTLCLCRTRLPLPGDLHPRGTDGRSR